MDDLEKHASSYRQDQEILDGKRVLRVIQFRNLKPSRFEKFSEEATGTLDCDALFSILW